MKQFKFKEGQTVMANINGEAKSIARIVSQENCYVVELANSNVRHVLLEKDISELDKFPSGYNVGDNVLVIKTNEQTVITKVVRLNSKEYYQLKGYNGRFKKESLRRVM